MSSGEYRFRPGDPERNRTDPTADRVYERWYTGESITMDSIRASGHAERDFAVNLLESMGFEPRQKTRRRDYEGRDPLEHEDRMDRYVLDGDGYRVSVSLDAPCDVEGVHVQEVSLREDIDVEWSFGTLDYLMQYFTRREDMADIFADFNEGEELFDVEEYEELTDRSQLWDRGLGRDL